MNGGSNVLMLLVLYLRAVLLEIGVRIADRHNACNRNMQAAKLMLQHPDD
jgi:hypothetical protein